MRIQLDRVFTHTVADRYVARKASCTESCSYHVLVSSIVQPLLSCLSSFTCPSHLFFSQSFTSHITSPHSPSPPSLTPHTQQPVRQSFPQHQDHAARYHDPAARLHLSSAGFLLLYLRRRIFARLRCPWRYRLFPGVVSLGWWVGCGLGKDVKRGARGGKIRSTNGRGVHLHSPSRIARGLR